MRATHEEGGVFRVFGRLHFDGDLWILGPHRLLCAGSFDTGSYEYQMEAEVARLVITDPPYKVRITYNVSGLGATRHRDFAMASADDPIGTEDRIKFVIGSGLP